MTQSTLAPYQSTDQPDSDKPYKNPDWLHRQYWKLDRPLRELADEAGVTKRTIAVWMQKHGIPRRRDGRPTDGDTAPLKDATWLRQRYWYDCLSTREIAALLDVTYYAVQSWMREHGIGRRQEGEHSFNESSRLDYGPGWSDATREDVRDRDGRECVDCGMSSERQLEEYGRKLNVHHIVPARRSSNPAVYNAPRNLVTLCQSCHIQREARGDDGPAGAAHQCPQC